jgi:hypothetical protein
MRKLASIFLTSAFLTSVAIQPALADDWRGHGDIHLFHEHDYDHWREGRWFNGFHEGRNGWWWIVGGLWYFYPAPVYPFPNPYTPPDVVVETIPVAPMGAPPSSYVYYCVNPAGYYPYVPQCYGSWQRVVSNAVAAPPVAQAPVVSPPAPPSMPPVSAPALSQREIDDRQLNSYAAEFQNVDLRDRHARTTLKNLEKQVEVFRQSLYQRGYNAMDILRDAENLQHRIAEQTETLPKHRKDGQGSLSSP